MWQAGLVAGLRVGQVLNRTVVTVTDVSTTCTVVIFRVKSELYHVN